MDDADRFAELRHQTRELLHYALEKVRDGRKGAGTSLDTRFQVAEYLVGEAREYLDGAWELLLAGKPSASLTLSRWLLEAALNLLWVVSERAEIDARLASLRGNALRLAALQHEGMAELVPSQASARRALAKKARRLRDEDGADSLKPLAHRVDEAMESLGDDAPRVYALFRLCSAAAHSSLEPPAPDAPDARSQYVEDIAVWMPAATTLYLVAGVYSLVGVGEAEALKRWWADEISPLLPS
ncbi:MAG: hypothetical protein IH830_10040 [Planctomycetes bacterium]|nr:hypothetical protein [Planctomycetota bacterium]